MKNAKKSNKVLKVISIILAVIIVLFIGADIYAGNFMLKYAIGRSGSGANRNVALDVEAPKSDLEIKLAENTKLQNSMNDEFVASTKILETSIPAQDGIMLKGFYALNNSNNWALIVHGYRSTHNSMLTYAQRYYAAGYNVITPDMRCCGESEGDYVGMGWKDKDDMLCWINWIIDQNPNAKIVVHGNSMGGATTMMLAGEKTPSNVTVFVEDCGYTSVWDIFASELKLRFGLPTFPILSTTSVFAKSKAGYNFKEASSINQLKKAEKPMLFIHGTADAFVPYEMLQKLYDAKPGTNKKMLTVEGAAHCKSIYMGFDDYWNQVFEFIQEYSN